ncbi:MAG: hypothetical protein AAF567_14150 [Actinomycetota bacterium]
MVLHSLPQPSNSPDDGDVPRADDDRRPPNHLPALRRIIRRCLRAVGPDREDSSAGSSALRVLGIRGSDFEPIATASGHAPDAILGLVVPPKFDAVVAVAESVVAATHGKHRAQGALAVAVTRSGDEVCFLQRAGAISETWNPQGWLVDACRRSLGLASHPEDAHALELPLALWLDQLMVEIVSGGSLTWERVVELCPVPNRWKSNAAEQLGVTLATVTPAWPALRAAVASGVPLPVPLAPADAAWMDAPMFARWCLGFFPELSALRADLEFLAPGHIAERIDVAVRAAYSAAVG